MMTRSIAREPDQENQTDLPMQRCSIPGEISKAVPKMNSTSSPGPNGTITTRYGRSIKLVHSEENQSIKVNTCYFSENVYNKVVCPIDFQE